MLDDFFDIAEIFGDNIDDEKNSKNGKDEAGGNLDLRHTNRLYHDIMGR